MPSGKDWLDVGCGTGALTQTILETAHPASVRSIDMSAGFVEYAREHVRAGPVRFEVGDARSLSVEDRSVDAAVSGLVLNFVPEPERAAAELLRVVRAGGVAAAYVWDYAGKMELMRYFWDEAVALDPAAEDLDEGRRFPLCRAERLHDLLESAGFAEVATRSIDVPTPFRDFGDYWNPFLGGQGPAPAYAMSLTEPKRAALRDRIRARLPFEEDGSIRLIARAWAVRGRKP